MHAFCFIRVNRRFMRLDFGGLVYLEARGGYTKLFLADGTNMMVHVKLCDWESMLPSYFIRVNKSYVLNLTKVSGFTAEQAWIGDKVFNVSKERKQSLLQHPFVFNQTMVVQAVKRAAVKNMEEKLQLN